MAWLSKLLAGATAILLGGTALAESPADLRQEEAARAEASQDPPPPLPPRGRLIDRKKLTTGTWSAAEQSNEIARQRATMGLETSRLPMLDEYLAAMIARLVRGVGMVGDVISVRLVARNQLGAQVTPNGMILANIGLVTDVRNEDELAFILAHEISHTILGHYRQRVGEGVRADVDRVFYWTKEVAKVLGVERTKPGDTRKVLLSYDAFDLASELAVSHLTRDDEDEADLFGIDLMARAGYNPAAASTILARIPDFEGIRLHVPSIIPPPDNPSGLMDQSRSANLLNLLGRKIDEFLGSARLTLKSEAKKRHRTTDERRAYVSAYLDHEYSSEVRRPLTTQSLERVRREASVARGLSQHSDAFAALEELTVGRFDIALKKAVIANRDGGDRHSAVATALARVYLQRFDLTSAAKAINNAERFGEPSLNLTTIRIKVLEGQRRVPDAVTFAENAAKSFGDSPRIMTHLVRLYRMNGRPQDAENVAARCQMLWGAAGEVCARGEAD